MKISRGNGLLMILGVVALIVIIEDLVFTDLWMGSECSMIIIIALIALLLSPICIHIQLQRIDKLSTAKRRKREERIVIAVVFSTIILGGTFYAATDYSTHHSYRIEINRDFDDQQERLVLNAAEHLDYEAILNISRYRCGDVMDPAVGSEPYYIDSIVIDQYQDWVEYGRANNLKGIYHIRYRAGVHVVDKLNVSAQSIYSHQSIGWSTEPKTVDIHTQIRPWTILAVSNGTDYDVVRRETRVNLTKDFLGQYLVEMHFESQGYYLRQYVLFGQDMQVPFVYAERNIWFY